MLVINGKPGEQIYVGDNITITVVEIRNRIRLNRAGQRFCSAG